MTILNKSFFLKHQKKILYIANNKFLRFLIGLNRLPGEYKNIHFDAISPNSFSFFDGLSFSKKGGLYQKNKSVFFTTPRFAEALAMSFSPFFYFQTSPFVKYRFRFSPVGLCFFLLSFLIPRIFFPFLFLTTSSFYSGAGDGAADTYLTNAICSETFWNAVRDRATGTWAGYKGTAYDIGHQIKNNGAVTNGVMCIKRQFFPFDTAGLPDEDTIISAKLKIKASAIYNDYSGNANSGIAILIATQAKVTEVVAADYSKCGPKNDATKYSAGIALADFTAGATKEITLLDSNSDNFGYIIKDGWTKFGMRNLFDINGVYPGTPANDGKTYLCQMNIYMSERAGTADDPLLEVIHESPASPFTPQILIF